MNNLLNLNGIDEINDLLFQILIVIFPILAYQLFWIQKHDSVETKKGRTISFIFYAITITFCMLFPIHFDPEHRYDLRMIPLTIGYLYLGHRAGLLLIAWVMFLRIALGGYFGILHAILNYLLYLPGLYLVAKSYQSADRLKRIKLFFFLNIYFYFCFLLSSGFDNFILVDTHALSIFIAFILVSLVTNIFVISIIESVQDNLRMKAELQHAEKISLLSSLTGVFAHEIRNPMQVTRGFLQLLNSDDLPEKKREYIQISIEELDRANMIINDFLTFAKPTSGDKEEVDLKNQLLRVINMIQTFSLTHNIHIQTNLREGCWVFANPQRLDQCFLNIFKNAVEAMPEGGEIHVGCSPSNSGFVEITIKDHGIGMTKEQVDALGSPFYSLKKGGTGLGMMVTMQIIRSYQGKLRITSEVGKGTTFTILLPVYKGLPSLEVERRNA